MIKPLLNLKPVGWTVSANLCHTGNNCLNQENIILNSTGDLKVSKEFKYEFNEIHG